MTNESSRIDEMIAVLQAAKAGKQIQFQRKDCLGWYDLFAPNWNWAVCDYRVKPEPREWVVPLSVLDDYNSLFSAGLTDPARFGYVRVRDSK